jgi:uncharacterized protein YjiS (DUF1127 family)
MHACTHESELVEGRESGLFAGAWRAVTTYFREAARRNENRTSAAALLSLDDYLLRDIGVRRADVERLVRHGRR